MNISKPGAFFWYATVFVEGGSVMAAELLAARLIAPYFGSSIYAWSGVLVMALLGLATGYYLGGRMSLKPKREKLLLRVLALGSVVIAFLPVIAEWILSHTLNLEIRTGIIISLFVFFFPPLTMMAMTSPVIVGIVQEKKSVAGYYTGLVYAISTVGGVVTVLLYGFWLIPLIGIRSCCLVAAFVLMIIPLVGFFLTKQHYWNIVLVILIAIAIWINYFKIISVFKDSSQLFSLQYNSEGYGGHLSVIDDLWGNHRLLTVNNTTQTNMDLTTGESMWAYVHRLGYYAKYKEKGGTALVAGIAGGNLLNKLTENGYSVDAVDIDQRMPYLAQKYFGCDSTVHFIIDDVRHYINICKKKYDLIIWDVSQGENHPEYLYTYDSFVRTSDCLEKDGMFFIHFEYYHRKSLDKDDNLTAVAAILHTINQSGFKVDIIKTPSVEIGDCISKEYIFFARKDPAVDLTNWEVTADMECTQYQIALGTQIYDHQLDEKTGYLLTDDRPLVEYLCRESAIDIRRRTIFHALIPLSEEGLQMFR